MFLRYVLTKAEQRGGNHQGVSLEGAHYKELYEEGMNLEYAQGVVGPCSWPWMMGNLIDELEPVYVRKYGSLPASGKTSGVPITWKDDAEMAAIVKNTVNSYDPNGTGNVRSVPGRQRRQDVIADMHRVLNAIAMGKDWGKQIFEEWLRQEEVDKKIRATSQQDFVAKYHHGKGKSAKAPSPASSSKGPPQAAQMGAAAVAAPAHPPIRATRPGEAAGAKQAAPQASRKKAKGATPTPPVAASPKPASASSASGSRGQASSSSNPAHAGRQGAADPAIAPRPCPQGDIRGDTVPSVRRGGPADTGGAQQGWRPNLPVQEVPGRAGRPQEPAHPPPGRWRGEQRSRTPVPRAGQQGEEWTPNPIMFNPRAWYWQHSRVPPADEFMGAPLFDWCPNHSQADWDPETCPYCGHITYWWQQWDIREQTRRNQLRWR